MKKIEFWQNCDTKSLEILLSKTKDIATFKNIQAVYLKAKYNMNAESVAQITGFSKGYVWQIHSSYRNNGQEAFVLCKKGGAYHINLDARQEKELLANFIDKSDAGHILEVSQIKKKYEELTARPVHKSVVYRMLARHGWRKIAPRTSHPKNSQVAMATFKKTSHKWCKMA
ncbi:MAG: winged helix-turn-helix domain-containing protein [Pedobacter sp.]|nr:winged helix-turn-helix domain-containing protein [Pedobacter sp.]